jgi:hypothetical protein
MSKACRSIARCRFFTSTTTGWTSLSQAIRFAAVAPGQVAPSAPEGPGKAGMRQRSSPSKAASQLASGLRRGAAAPSRELSHMAPAGSQRFVEARPE